VRAGGTGYPFTFDETQSTLYADAADVRQPDGVLLRRLLLRRLLRRQLLLQGLLLLTRIRP